MRRLLPVVCIALAGLGLSAPAAAQGRQIEIAPTSGAMTPADRAACLSNPGVITEDRTAACTRVIEFGQVAGGDLVQAYLLRGISFVVFADDCDHAIADATEMLRLDSKNARAYGLRGGCLAHKGDFDHALVDLNHALPNPGGSLVPNAFAKYYLGKGDYDRAMAEASEAVRLNGQSATAFLNRGLGFEGKGALNKAQADFRRAVSIDPQKRQVPVKQAADGLQRVEQKMAALGGADWAGCFSAPQTEQKIAACGRLIEAKKLGSDDLSAAYYQRATGFALVTGDIDRVIADCSEAVRLDATNTNAFATRGAGFARKGLLDRALADLNEGQRLNPNNAGVHNGLGIYYAAVGDYDRALAEYNEAIRLFPQFAAAYRNRGVAYEKKGQFNAALADFHVALGYDPTKKLVFAREAADGIARIEARLAAPATPNASAAAPSSARAPAVVPGKRVALVIGNDKYESLQPLQKAANDARVVADHLGKLGFEVILAENANRRTMSEKLTELTGRLGRGDTAFFFFAGHGIAIKDGNYLLPTDTPQVSEGQESLLTREAIGADSIVDALQDRGARVIVMVLDACRDNPFKKAGSRGVGASGGLGEMRAPEGVFVLYSAGFGQTALDRLNDSDANVNSVFTRTFAPLLDRPGLSLQELAKITQSEVKKLSSSVNHVQMPAYYDQIDGALALR